MKNNKVKQNKSSESRELALHYMKTLVEVTREPILILDSNLRVISANPMFYQSFQVSPKKTENVLLYHLGNGQWNIPKLKNLLEEILPRNKTVKDYEVTHIFETVGKKTILLNARQIDAVQLIILAMEDISDRKSFEEKLAKHAEDLEVKVAERTEELTARVEELESLNKTMVGRELKMVELKKEIAALRGEPRSSESGAGNGKNGNGNHRNGRQK